MATRIPSPPSFIFRTRMIKCQSMSRDLRAPWPTSLELFGSILTGCRKMMANGCTKVLSGASTKNILMSSPSKTKTTTNEQSRDSMTNPSSSKATVSVLQPESNQSKSTYRSVTNGTASATSITSSSQSVRSMIAQLSFDCTTSTIQLRLWSVYLRGKCHPFWRPTTPELLPSRILVKPA